MSGDKKELQGAAKVARDVVAGTCGASGLVQRLCHAHALTELIVAACAGGIVVTLVGHPFDTLKIRLQTQPSGKPIYCASQSCCCPRCPLSVCMTVAGMQLA